MLRSQRETVGAFSWENRGVADLGQNLVASHADFASDAGLGSWDFQIRQGCVLNPGCFDHAEHIGTYLNRGSSPELFASPTSPASNLIFSINCGILLARSGSVKQVENGH